MARTGIATASSSDKNTKPQWAIDGNMDNSLSHHSCSLTKRENDPFWKVTVKETIHVYEVAVETSVNCCGKSENEVLFPTSRYYSHNHIISSDHNVQKKRFVQLF